MLLFVLLHLIFRVVSGQFATTTFIFNGTSGPTVATAVLNTNAIGTPSLLGALATGGLATCIDNTAIPALETKLNCLPSSLGWPCVCLQDYGDALSTLVSASCSKDVNGIPLAESLFMGFCVQLVPTAYGYETPPSSSVASTPGPSRTALLYHTY